MTKSPHLAKDILRDVFGFSAFKGDQAAIVEHLVQGGDAFVLMPTGGGKSLCYQLPALLRQGVGIVISPLIALMHDQVQALQKLGIKAAALNSTMTGGEGHALIRALFEDKIDLLYVAPERLLTEFFLSALEGLVEVNKIALFAIDEAHCIAHWGHDFRPEYAGLSVLHQRFPLVPRIALTATANLSTREEIKNKLDLNHAKTFVSSFNRPNIFYRVVEKSNQRQQLLELIARHNKSAGIVYCSSRKKVEQISTWLNTQGIAAVPYHAGLPPEERNQNQRRFHASSDIIMVATIAFGMGIDKSDIRFVAHLDLPKSLEAYYQETGRAGRDGQPAEAWMSFGLTDVIHRIQHLPSEELVGFINLLQYAEARSCRRKPLLASLGETIDDCGYCDACLSPPLPMPTDDCIGKALSAIYRSCMRFSATDIVDLLRGNASSRILRADLQSLAVFGIGADKTQTEWRRTLRYLLAQGLITVHPHGNLVFTEATRQFLKPANQ